LFFPNIFYHRAKHPEDRFFFMGLNGAIASPELAEKFGRGLRKQMIPRTKISAATPMLHDIPLYLGFTDCKMSWEGREVYKCTASFVTIPPDAKKEKTEYKDTLHGLKAQIARLFSEALDNPRGV